MAKVAKIKKASNFMGRGVDSGTSGLAPQEHGGMGIYYGRGARNPMGRLRSDTLGYMPVSKKQLGTPPKNVV